MRKLLTILGASMLIGIINVSAQDYLVKADKQFGLKAFDLAIYHYGLHLQAQPHDTDAMNKMAWAFFYVNKNKEAIEWLKKSDEIAALDAEHLILMGRACKKLGDYHAAVETFRRLVQIDEARGNHWLLGCEMAIAHLSEEERYEIIPFGGNSVYSDFGAVAFKDKWVFSSFRDDIRSISQKSEIVPGSKLLYTDFISSRYKNILPLRSTLKNNYRIGPISYSDDFTICAVGVNQFKDNYIPGYANDQENYIMLGEVLENGDFQNEVNFQHNVLGYSSTYPHLTHNGTMMYFSSNRPGGYGGYDIYVSKYDGKTWSEPMNLGPEINTPGNEITPFILGDEMYFASDYHHGLGGFDIFIASRKNGMWSRPINAGNGVNSPGDDLFPYIASGDENVIYFTSNRVGGVGNLDIYKAITIAETEKTFVFDHFIDDIPLRVSENKEQRINDNTVVTPDEMLVDQHLEGIDSGLKEMNESTKMLSYEGSLDGLNEDEKPEVYVMESVTTENPVMVTADLENARMVALDEPVQNGSMVYFVQLAAFSRTVDNANRFKSLVRYGNLYQVSESNLVKLRLGYYFDENHAREVLKTVKEQGFKDAFITREQLNTAKMELLFSNLDFDHPSSYMTESKFKGKSQYKVRLAAYEDPMWFDISKAKDIGRIEQWTKGGWTIFICSGYHSLEEAEKARLMALNKGFRDAELVFDNEGILEKVKRN